MITMLSLRVSPFSRVMAGSAVVPRVLASSQSGRGLEMSISTSSMIAPRPFSSSRISTRSENGQPGMWYIVSRWPGVMSGMGPLTELRTYGGKVFAGLYALYSGLFLIIAAGLLLAPLLHRFLHRLHLDEDQR